MTIALTRAWKSNPRSAALPPVIRFEVFFMLIISSRASLDLIHWGRVKQGMASIFLGATFIAGVIRLNLDGAERLLGYLGLFCFGWVFLPLVHKLVKRIFDPP
ncbi:hypothetical protein [Polaromonas sp.]|uniref:hypothetical protein n=1 Tax=Polaromonas sp. TaxID=1869339 RepID=UPI00272F2327|nr:hypothetical protein [Polaromonas sp.]MDP2449553.1 hypothetical protein [Polaromonas sp.]